LLHENKELKTPKLLHLDLETSSVCNFTCAMCPRPKENGQMELSDIKRIIKEFADQGGETIKPFHRGEPTADKRMTIILKYAKECGLKTMINTNGSDPHGIYEDCLPLIDWISFSIDEQHNNINNVSFNAVADAYRHCIDFNKYIEIQASSHNNFVWSLGQKLEIPYNVDLPTKRSDTDNESEVITGERKYCGFPDWRLIVQWNGDVVPCCLVWDSEIVVGNIHKQSLTEIFNSDNMTRLRAELKKNIFANTICKNCQSRSAYV